MIVVDLSSHTNAVGVEAIRAEETLYCRLVSTRKKEASDVGDTLQPLGGRRRIEVKMWTSGSLKTWRTWIFAPYVDKMLKWWEPELTRTSRST
jgi:hypothetical protein